jgi:hypothetical protein
VLSECGCQTKPEKKDEKKYLADPAGGYNVHCQLSVTYRPSMADLILQQVQGSGFGVKC